MDPRPALEAASHHPSHGTRATPCAIVTVVSARNIPEWARLLVRCGCQAPSADNSQPWRFVWDGRTLTLQLDAERGASSLGGDHPATLMAMGAAVENVAQAAAAIGLPSAALKFGSGLAGNPFVAIEWDGLVPVAATESQLASLRRHTNRGPHATTPIDPVLRDRIAAMTEGSAKTLVVSSSEGKRQLATLLRRASEVRFQTEELHCWLGASLRFTPAEVARGDGLDVATLLLPPGATALLRFSLDWRRMAVFNRFGVHKVFAALEAAMFSKSAALVAIVGSVRDPSDALAGGRLLERAWIALNDAGMAVHPYYGLSDQLFRLRAGRVAEELRPVVAAIEGEVTAMLGSGEETMFMLLRTGRPSVESPPLSRRLPLESVLTILEC